MEAVDEKLIRNVSWYAQAQISPVASFWGGIITQEIIKGTGKYSPLQQWLHHEYFDMLPESPAANPHTLHLDRYSDYRALFGDDYAANASAVNTLLVGAGALGCEYIKMFALMGVAQQGKGLLFCADDDNIEISNLNRQFLFRKKHVGQSKCETACRVGKTINPQCRFECRKMRVAPENENVLNDEFWTSLTFVVGAVDNVSARKYIDNQCVWYEKALFDAGTMGTKCHSQIIVPHATISYNDIQDPPEESITLCTLKNFPYQIEHTIEWARDFFQGTFADPSSELVRFYQLGPKYLDQIVELNKLNPTMLLGKLQNIHELYTANEARSYGVCIELAVNMFYEVLYNQILNLITTFPENSVNEETKKLFWSGLKRFPKPLKLSFEDQRHVEFVQAAANIYAGIFKLPVENDKARVVEMAKTVRPKEFVPRKVKVETDEKKKPGDMEEAPVVLPDEEADCKTLLAKLRAVAPDQAKAPSAMEFEKDDPANFHIEFMGSLSNLRARNYCIEEVTNFKVKLIAGKIIPAIATTTAMVVGAVGIELIRCIMKQKATSYRNLTANLALPLWVYNDPIEPVMNVDKEFDPIMCGPIRVIPGKFTKWDKIDIKGPFKLGDFIKHFEETYSIDVSMVNFGTVSIFSPFGDGKARLPMDIIQAIENVTKTTFAEWKRIIPLSVSGSTKDGTDCILPDVRYHRSV